MVFPFFLWEKKGWEYIPLFSWEKKGVEIDTDLW